jgi:hypothetical protein
MFFSVYIAAFAAQRRLSLVAPHSWYMELPILAVAQDSCPAKAIGERNRSFAHRLGEQDL